VLCLGQAVLGQLSAADGWQATCAPSVLPDGVSHDTLSRGGAFRVWEPVPSVIRADGIDAFRLEVTVEAPMASVTLGDVSTFLITPEALPVPLRDDGLGEDRQAGDLVYTSGLFRYDTDVALPEFFWRDPDSPPGLFQSTIGTVFMLDQAGATTEFLLEPSIGLMDPGLAQSRYIKLNDVVQVSSHLINVRVDQRHVQRSLRLIDDTIASVTRRIYEQVPDDINFFTFFSIDKVELLPSDAQQNFFIGRHLRAQTDFSGTELPIMDETSAYDSAGTLLGINLLDGYGRGTTTSNATHELLHHWAAYVTDALLSEDGHYRSQSSAASLVGGFRWIDNGDGTYTRDCETGRNGAYRIPVLDLYFMGLVSADQVGTIWLSNPSDPLRCGDVITGPILPVSVDSVAAHYGERLPPPGVAPRAFRNAFVVASHNRFLNPTELAFYHTLAAHYAAPIPAGAPDPYVGDNWVSVERFFGAAATWRTDVPMRLDGDGDGDVDVLEYRVLKDCLTGPGEPARVSCARWDHDGDERIDLSDAAAFMQFFTGPEWR